jgi:hypothetical protein
MKPKYLVEKEEEEKSLSFDEVMQLIEETHDILVSSNRGTTTFMLDKLFDAFGNYQGSMIENEIVLEPVLTQEEEILSLDEVTQQPIPIRLGSGLSRDCSNSTSNFHEPSCRRRGGQTWLRPCQGLQQFHFQLPRAFMSKMGS